MKYLLCALTIISIGCGKQIGKSNLLGKWERFGDEHSGAMVVVEPEGDHLIGRLIEVPKSLEQTGFVKNDIKWRDIEVLGPKEFTGKDLWKKGVMFFGELRDVEINYYDFRLIIDDGGILRTRLYAKGSENVGTEQMWKKIKD